MAGERAQVGHLRQLGALQQLRRDAAAGQLARCEQARIAVAARLHQAQAEAQELQRQLQDLLDSAFFDCGAYSLSLVLLDAQAGLVRDEARQLDEAEEQSRRAVDTFRKADIQGKLLDREIRQLARKLARKDEDRRAARHLDRFNTMRGAVGA